MISQNETGELEMTTEDNAPALSEAEQRFIERAKNDEFANGGIVRYYNQALKQAASEAVLEAIELRMRTDFPREARKVFGAKGLQAEDLLARAQEAAGARFDLSNNGRRNHVMVGGDERREVLGCRATSRTVVRGRTMAPCLH
jgi:hypothetical protein